MVFRFSIMADSLFMNNKQSGIQREQNSVKLGKKGSGRKSEEILLTIPDKRGQLNGDEAIPKREGYNRLTKKDCVTFEKQESEDFCNGERGRKRKEPFEDVVVAEDYVEFL